MRLIDLAPGQTALVHTIDCGRDDLCARRMHEMGFDEGIEVELLHRAPLGGDPIAVRVGGSIVALRRAQAALITTEPAHAPLALAAE